MLLSVFERKKLFLRYWQNFIRETVNTNRIEDPIEERFNSLKRHKWNTWKEFSKQPKARKFKVQLVIRVNFLIKIVLKILNLYYFVFDLNPEYLSLLKY